MGFRIKWAPLAAGGVVALAGAALFLAGWSSVTASEGVPSFRSMVLLGSGSLLLLIGGVTALTPTLLALLRFLYGDDFGRSATCPVMVVCGSCGTYNARGRARCKSCAGGLEGARAVGGSAGSSDA